MASVTALADDAQTPPTDSDVHAAFSWFDTLGYPNLGTAPFVEVTGGNNFAYSDCSDLPPNHHRFAFLLSDNGPTFRVFYTDLEVATLAKARGTESQALPASYRRIDIETCARSSVAHLERDAKDGMDAWDGLADVRANVLELFILARACSSRGFDTIGVRLAERSAVLLNLPEGKLQYYERIRNATALSLMDRATWMFPMEGISLTTLEASFREIAIRFPETTIASEAREYADLILQMMKEAKAHRHQRPPVSRHDQIAELIFELRDAYSTPSDYGPASIRTDMSAAGKLQRMGISAIPQLIDAISDQHLCRCISQVIVGSTSVHVNNDTWDIFDESRHAKRVGDVALAVINRIADASFGDNGCTQDGAIKPGRTAEVLASVKAWWSAYQPDIDYRNLSNAVASAGVDAAGSADLLIRRFPSLALPPLRKGVRAASDERTIHRLISAAAQLTDPGAAELLREQAVKGKSYKARIAASGWLLHDGINTEPSPLAATWLRVPPSTVFKGDVESLTAALAQSRSPSAVEALAANLRARPADVRVGVMLALEPGKFWIQDDQDGYAIEQPRTPTHDSSTLREATEKLLCSELTDFEYGPVESSTSLQMIHCWRNCDIAAYILSRVNPQRYRFTDGNNLRQMDTQLVTFYNIWAETNGLPRRPLPHAIPTTQTGAALELARRTTRATRSEELLYSIESDGIRSLPEILQTLKSASISPTLRQSLNNLATRLECIVTTVKLDGETRRLAPEASAMVKDLSGKPLTMISCIHTLEAFMRAGGSDTNLKFIAHRREGLAGIELTCEFKRVSGQQEASPQINHNFNISASGMKTVEFAGGGGLDAKTHSYGPISGDEYGRELRDGLARCLATRPGTPFTIDLRISPSSGFSDLE